jgi:phospholipid/cholesterol/gamma-HCH transport system substrate-binding protein
MKPRASNLMIGSVTLAVIAAAFAGGLGIKKIRSVRQQVPLRIIFAGSASGLHTGGNVNFDGIQVGQIKSLTLDNPHKIVALVTLDNSAPIRADTAVGLEFQGLTGVAAIALTGGDASAPEVPVKDGIPTLTADLSETQSIRDSLHNVDRFLVDNRTVVKDALLNFETFTASLAGKGDEIDRVIGKADNAFAGFNGAIAKIDGLLPGLASGKDGELYQKVKSIRELAESFKKRSATFMEDGRRTLLDVSESARKMDGKFVPQSGSSGGAPASARPPRRR